MCSAAVRPRIRVASDATTAVFEDREQYKMLKYVATSPVGLVTYLLGRSLTKFVLATASAVVGDLIDLARGRVLPAFSVPAAALKPLTPSPMDRHQGAYYVRLMVIDRPGVIADVAAALRDERISMESMIQRGRSPGSTVAVVVIMHEAEEAAMRRALDRIATLEAVAETPRMIRIEAL